MTTLTVLEDHALIECFASLVERDRRNTAAMLAHLEEIDRRQLYAAQGYSSLFSWCVQRFHMSESMAGKRIGAARLARKFPIVLEMVAAGDVHLSALSMLGPHLTESNHREVLERARHQSKREIERLVAELAPKPDAPTRIVAVRDTPPAARAAAPGSDQTTSFALLPPPAQVKPLSPDRYKVQLTISAGTHEKLRKLQALMAHAIPGDDPAAIIDRALDALLAKVMRDRAAVVKKPRRRGTAAKKPARSRSVAAAVRREVWARDGGACSFVGVDGHRCGETRLLQIHHLHPYARGGESTALNLALRCATHNHHEAVAAYGEPFMDAKRRGATPRVRESFATYHPMLPNTRAAVGGEAAVMTERRPGGPLLCGASSQVIGAPGSARTRCTSPFITAVAPGLGRSPREASGSSPSLHPAVAR